MPSIGAGCIRRRGEVSRVVTERLQAAAVLASRASRPEASAPSGTRHGIFDMRGQSPLRRSCHRRIARCQADGGIIADRCRGFQGHVAALDRPLVVLLQEQGAAFNPSCASSRKPSGFAAEITSLTPRRPRRVSERRNSVSASELPVATPSTLRLRSVLTAIPTITATETMRWSRRALT